MDAFASGLLASQPKRGNVPGKQLPAEARYRLKPPRLHCNRLPLFRLIFELGLAADAAALGQSNPPVRKARAPIVADHVGGGVSGCKSEIPRYPVLVVHQRRRSALPAAYFF